MPERRNFGPKPAVLLAPKALDHLSVDLAVVHSLDGVRGLVLVREAYESVALVLEHAYVLDDAERRERLVHELVGDAVGEATAVHRRVGRRALVVHLLEGRLLAARRRLFGARRRRLPRRPVCADRTGT